jgi:hypothetical protein
MSIRVPSRPARGALLLGLALLWGSTVLLGQSVSHAAATGPTLSLDPASAPSGWEVNAAGTGWDLASGDVSIFRDVTDSNFPDAALATATPDATGAFSKALLVPTDVAGNYVFFACQQCGDADGFPAARSPFTIEVPPTPSLLLDPSAARSGSTVGATGAGWNPVLGRVSIFRDAADSLFPTSILAARDPDPAGSFSAPLVVPMDVEGDHVFYACQQCDDPTATATAPFTILPPVTTAPPPRLRTVPNVVGMSVAQALAVIQRRHLAPELRWIGSGENRGRVVSQHPLAGTRVPSGTSVFATARRTLVTASAGASWPRRAASGGILLILAAAAAVLWWRPRRQRAWVRRHVRTEPRTGPAHVTAEQGLDAEPSHTVTLQVHRDRGTQTLEEVDA